MVGILILFPRWSAAQWVQTGGPTGGGISSLAVSGSNINAGTMDGVYLSTNNGTSWINFNANLKETNINSIAVNGSDIFVGTKGSGVWRMPLSEMTRVAYDKPLIVPSHRAHFKILSPGATNSPAIIVFSLLHPGKVIFTVYNISGHEIASLVNENLESGLHRVSWDTRHVAAGFYTIRMQAGSNSSAISISILR